MSEPVPTHPMISPHSERAEGKQMSPPGGAPSWDGPPPPEYLGSAPQGSLWDLPGKVSVRWRLTIAYSGMFFVAAAVVVMSLYTIAGSTVDTEWPNLNLRGVAPIEATIAEAQWRAVQTQTRQNIQEAMLRSSIMALVGVGIFAVIIGYFVADRALRPVSKMTATARKLSDGNLSHQRIALQGPDDELKEMADTFDDMLTRLNIAFDTQRRFVANASHELRTPLTINRTVLEIALGDPGASEDLKALGRTLLEVNARNEKLIEGLLLLARSERELAVRKPLDIKDVARTAVEQVTPFAEEHGVTVTTELTPAGTVGDPVLLERCVSNLLENAVKYNLPDNGKVWIRTGMADGALVVQVANTGQHVP
ncbi:HAMP domain-containing sensor histidine kinase, partial [Nonomuraea sp. NPDC055795]